VARIGAPRGAFLVDSSILSGSTSFSLKISVFDATLKIRQSVQMQNGALSRIYFATFLTRGHTVRSRA
jgi:hypothetical protein